MLLFVKINIIPISAYSCRLTDPEKFVLTWLPFHVLRSHSCSRVPTLIIHIFYLLQKLWNLYPVLCAGDLHRYKITFYTIERQPYLLQVSKETEIIG